MAKLSDFTKPFKWLGPRGSDEEPMEITLIVVAWEPTDYGDPPLSKSEIEQLFFGANDSVAHWIASASHGRYKIKPHTQHAVLGPYPSKYPWPFYWRNATRAFYDPTTSTWTATRTDPDTGVVESNFVMNRLSAADWESNPYKVPPPVDSGHLYIHPENGLAYYLDDEGFIGGHNHSWAEAIRRAAEDINFKALKTKPGNILGLDEAAVVVVKAQTKSGGTSRPASGKDVPKEDLEVDGVIIPEVCEVYAGAPLNDTDLATAVEEVIHLILRYADEYRAPPVRTNSDPGRPGQLSLSDAGGRPVNVGAYFRLKWGWCNPKLADHDGTYTVSSIETGDEVLIVPSRMAGRENEFFLIENRYRGTSYDRFRTNVWGDGLAIWHIVEDEAFDFSIWARHAVNLRRADPTLPATNGLSEGRALFDGADPTRSYILSDSSAPQHLRFKDGVQSGITIQDISPAAATMSLRVHFSTHLKISHYQAAWHHGERGGLIKIFFDGGGDHSFQALSRQRFGVMLDMLRNVSPLYYDANIDGVVTAAEDIGSAEHA